MKKLLTLTAVIAFSAPGIAYGLPEIRDTEQMPIKEATEIVQDMPLNSAKKNLIENADEISHLGNVMIIKKGNQIHTITMDKDEFPEEYTIKEKPKKTFSTSDQDIIHYFHDKLNNRTSNILESTYFSSAEITQIDTNNDGLPDEARSLAKLRDSLWQIKAYATNEKGELQLFSPTKIITQYLLVKETDHSKTRKLLDADFKPLFNHKETYLSDGIFTEIDNNGDGTIDSTNIK